MLARFHSFCCCLVRRKDSPAAARITREIESAAHEQNDGIERIDYVTQDNAALIEELAGAPTSQAHTLHEAVAVFRLGGIGNEPGLRFA